MKRLLTFCCVALATFALFAASAKGTPEISFEQTAIDFGNIRESDGAVTCTFKYVNTGSAPLALTTVSAPCGCTKTQYSHKPLAPGKAGKIVVTFSPKDIKGEFMRSISVWTNVRTDKGKKKKVSLKISGVVIPN